MCKKYAVTLDERGLAIKRTVQFFLPNVCKAFSPKIFFYSGKQIKVLILWTLKIPATKRLQKKTGVTDYELIFCI